MLVSDGENSHLITASLRLSPTEKPTSSRGAKNKLIEMFLTLGTEFEKAINDDRISTEEFLALETQKVEILKNITENQQSKKNLFHHFLLLRNCAECNTP